MCQTPYAFLLMISLLCCACSPKLSSTDFTKEGGFTNGIEGPATDYKGNIYAVNFGEQGTIGKVRPDGKASLFVKLPKGSIGNGIRFGEKHQMFVADYTNHNVLEIDLATKEIKVFAHQPKANQPNDLAISPQKRLYASDPNWSDSTGNLWMVTKEKGFELLESGMGTTNGVEVSQDGRTLYVNESIQRKVWAYDIASDGSLSNKRIFYNFKDFGLDGMRCHQNGDLYICRYGKGTVAILSPKGNLVKEIKLTGQKPSNITFSPDYKKCYITLADRGCLETVKL